MFSLGAAVILEGDHSSRSAGRHATYDVHMRMSASRVPVLTVTSHSSADRASSISVPLHTSAGCGSGTSLSSSSSASNVHNHNSHFHQHQNNNNNTNHFLQPNESIRETFDAIAKPIVQAIAHGEEPVGTVVIDSAGAPRNRVAIGVLEHCLSFFCSSSASRVHASLVEVDSRGELVDVLDPSSPHVPRVDENFDAGSVHIANATMLDVMSSRHNRARVSRSLVPGKHCVCTIIIRRRDGSLGSLTVISLQACGDGTKAALPAASLSPTSGAMASASHHHHAANNSNSQFAAAAHYSLSAFRGCLQAVSEGLTADPVPPTLPFSKTRLTFLLKGALCQTYPCAWIIALSPWFEVASEKEAFADACIVMKSARQVAALTDLALNPAGASRSPPRFTQQNQQLPPGSASSSPFRNRGGGPGGGAASSAAAAAAVSVAIADAFSPPSSPAERQKSQQQQQHQHRQPTDEQDPLASTTPPRRRDDESRNQNGIHKNNNGVDDHRNNQQQSQNSSSLLLANSLVNSPIPKESASIPQPMPGPILLGGAGGGAAAASAPVVSALTAAGSASDAVTIVTLQQQLKQSQSEAQQQRVRILALTSQLAEAEARAARCESIVAALQQHGSFHQQQQHPQPPAPPPPPVAPPVSAAPAAAAHYHFQAPPPPPPPQQQQQQHHRRSTSLSRHIMSPAVDFFESSTVNDDYLVERGAEISNFAPASSSTTGGAFTSLGITVPNRSTPPRGEHQHHHQHHQQHHQQHHHYNNNDDNSNNTLMVQSNIWSRAPSVSHSAVRQQPTPLQEPPQDQQQQQQTQQQQQLPAANDLIVVGYNFELSEEEAEAVRREMEKRSATSSGVSGVVNSPMKN